MVSWSDGETSDGGFDLEEDFSGTIYDPDYCGIATDNPRLCHHYGKLERFVAFQGTDTGRRFLGCADHEGTNCGFVEWVDLEWPDALKKALTKLWDLYEESKSGRIGDNLFQADKNYQLAEDKRLLEMELNMVKDELKKIMEEKRTEEDTGGEALRLQAKKERSELKMAVQQKEMAQLMRLKAEQERDKLKEEKKKLEYCIADLLNAAELNKGKIKEIKAIYDA